MAMALLRAIQQCYRKKPFGTMKGANRRIKKIVDEGGPELFAYECRNCGQFHLTKNPTAHGKTL